MPELKIRKLEGLPIAQNLTERSQLSDELIPFYLTHNEDDKPSNCLENPNNCTTSFIFQNMGMLQQQNENSARKKRQSGK